MKKIIYLSTCNTCMRILKELDPPLDFVLQDLKTEPLTEEQIENLKKLSGSYEKLFNRRARLYQDRDLKSKELSPADYKNLLLEHYTFAKRPIIVNEMDLFIGNSKKTIVAAKNSVGG